MPELPEVETTVRGMNATIKGKSITQFWSDWDKILRGVTARELEKQIIGKKIIDIERRGKNILTHLSGGYTLLMHMKMTGHFMYGEYVYNKDKNSWEPQDKSSALADPFNRFIHVVFSLSNNKQLAFCDVRKFGKIELIQTKEIYNHLRLRDMGPEPLTNEFTHAVFLSQIKKKSKTKIKQVLLDQYIVAGIGNIYADESLHRAGIHPERAVASLTLDDSKRLHKAIVYSLQKGLTLGGDSTSDYRNIHGEKGLSQNTHKVYRQTGKKCTKKGCEGIIQRTVVAARGTHFCHICQQ
jgi:formamidopyrimidine-DNA glycosylase